MRPSAANRSFSRKIRLTAAGLSSGGRIGLHVEQFGFVIERLVGPHSQRPVALGAVGQRGRDPQIHLTPPAPGPGSASTAPPLPSSFNPSRNPAGSESRRVRNVSPRS